MFKDTDTSREDHMTVEVETGAGRRQLEVSIPTAASKHKKLRRRVCCNFVRLQHQNVTG